MSNVDPITLEVVRGSLVSTVLQMRATLVRTAYAPILYETLDFSCGLLTADGELAAMSEDFAGHVFAMALGLNAALDKFGDDIHPGDVLAVNDPYTGGTHMNDIAFYSPFFVDGKVLLYIAVRAHWADVGGANPGSFSGQDTEIYQEGVRVVPVKLLEKGEINRGLWEVMFANMRLPDEQEGNAMAMLDTARVAEMAVAELCTKYGVGTIERCLEAFLDNAEDTMRQRIRELPDGEYYYEQYMDNSGLSPEPLPIKMKLTIEGDGMTFDFTGSSPQVRGPMNCGIPVTYGGVFVIIKSWLDPKTPVNGGTFRPMDFVVPPGSNLAATLPAPVGGCWEVFHQLQTAVIGAFSQVMPEEPSGENNGAANHVYVGGFDPVRGRHYILYEFPQGGNPGTSDTDGVSGSFLYDNGGMAAVYPAESAEQRQPLLIESLEFRTDGEGPGFRRSGFGVTRRVRVLSHDSQLSVMTDRAVIPPWGAAGAYPGSLNSITVLRGGVELQPSPIPGKIKSFPMEYGDVLLMQATAGGGVGDPLEREPELVQKEVFQGYVTRDRARDVYGVIIDDAGVDLGQTREMRERLKSERQYFEVTESRGDDFDERGCRVCPLSEEGASRIGVGTGDMVEYIGKGNAPLRAWVRLEDGLPADGAPIGPIGRRVLLVEAGDEIWLRRLSVNLPSSEGLER